MHIRIISRFLSLNRATWDDAPVSRHLYDSRSAGSPSKRATSALLHSLSAKWRRDGFALPHNLAGLVDEFVEDKATVVFHCMYSQSRGPKCARILNESMTKWEESNGRKRKCRIRILEGGFMAFERDCGDEVEYELGRRAEGPKNQHLYGE